MLGAVDLGGTKVLCAVGTGPDDLRTLILPTTTPSETLPRLVAALGELAGGRLMALGVASFGPIGLDPRGAGYGVIGSSPKAGWSNVDLLGPLRRAFSVPIGFDTDANGAALAEARWGAARGVPDFLHVAVGTGIGGGAVHAGRPVRGSAHLELGHIRIPHDRTRDPFPGVCPYHGDCWEGLASGPAMAQRWGAAPETWADDHAGWTLEAHYLALGLANATWSLAPSRIVLGGGVLRHAALVPPVRSDLLGLLAGYGPRPDVVPAKLGERSGVLGALLLAEQALTAPG